MSFNDITGDKIKTRVPTEKFSSGWDAIWGKKETKSDTDKQRESDLERKDKPQ